MALVEMTMNVHKKLSVKSKAILGFKMEDHQESKRDQSLLVVIFLRGGADGLSMVAPYADDGYYRNRVLTSIPAPNSNSARKLIDLDGFFGLHPALAALYPLYEGGELSFVHACGSGDTTLSHFAASNTVERGLYQSQGDSTGWLARLLDATPANSRSSIRAVSIGTLLPASLSGTSCAMALQSISDLTVTSPFAGGVPKMQTMLSSLYSGGDLVCQAGRQTLTLINQLKDIPKSISPESREYVNDDLGNGLRDVAQLAKSGTGLSVACVDQSGYDTHVVQGGVDGILSNNLANLAKNVSTFVRDIGRRQWNNTKIVVMSEFGRRVRENDGGGTDHGHGSVMMVLAGQGLRTRTIASRWPGLRDDQLDENGNLRSTTDYRNVLLEVIASQSGLAASESVFPDLRYRPVGLVHG